MKINLKTLKICLLATIFINITLPSYAGQYFDFEEIAGLDNGNLGVEVKYKDESLDDHIRLYIKGYGESDSKYRLVSRKTQQPYRWGVLSDNNKDFSILNLKDGAYILKAESDHKINGKYIYDIKLIDVGISNRTKVGSGDEYLSFAKVTGLNNGNLGIEVKYNDSSENAPLKLYIKKASEKDNNYKLVRKQRQAPYIWGVLNKDRTDNSIQNLEEGFYSLKVVSDKKVNGSNVFRSISYKVDK